MLVERSLLLLSFFALSIGIGHSSAFVVQHERFLSPFHRHRSSDSGSSLAYSAGMEGSTPQEIEQARVAFENLIIKSSTKFDGIIGGAERLRLQGDRRLRNIELELIKTLKESDDAVEGLIHLWTTERDSSAAADLKMMQTKCSMGLLEEEIRLKELMTEFPTWAEPCARLSHVMFYQGRNEDARRMAKHTLRLKPWHFEATQLLLSMAISEEDEAQVKHWSELVLPRLKGWGAKERRAKWVDNAVVQATKKITDSERAIGLVGKSYKRLVFIRVTTWE